MLAVKASSNQIMQKIFRTNGGEQRYSDLPIRMSELPTSPNTTHNCDESSNLPDICISAKNLFPSEDSSSDSLMQEIKDFSGNIVNKHQNIEDVSMEVKPTKRWKVISVKIVIPKKKRRKDFSDEVDENGNNSKGDERFKCSLVTNDKIEKSSSYLNENNSNISQTTEQYILEATTDDLTKTGEVANASPSFEKFKTTLEINTQSVQSTPRAKSNPDDRIEELIRKYQPVMGKRALLAKSKPSQNDREINEDEKIVHELVINKFNETLKKYQSKSLKRQLNKLRNTVLGHFESNDNCQTQKNVQLSCIEFISNEINAAVMENLEKMKTNESFQKATVIESLGDMNEFCSKINESFQRATVIENLGEMNEYCSKTNESCLKAAVVVQSEKRKEYDVESEDLSLLSRECAYDPRECTTNFSYDSEEFLKNALGDDYAKYNSTESAAELNETGATIEESVGTSNLSELISRGSTTYYSTVNKNFRRMNSTMTYPSVEEEIHTATDTQTQQKQSDKIEELMQQSLIHYQAMVQASKAIQFCEQTKEFLSSLEHVEAERLLLLSTCRREAVVEEMSKTDYATIVEDRNFGTVCLSKLFFPGRTVEQNKEFTRWFVCVVSCGVQIFATTAVKADSDGNVVFGEEFEFHSLSSDFEIDVSLYGMKLKNANRNYSHESRFHLNKQSSKRLCPNPKKIFTLHRASHSSLPSNSIRSTSFAFFGKAVVRINDLQRTDFFMFKLSPHSRHLFGTFRASFTTQVTLSENYKGFLNVGRETKKGITWNRLWCRLEGKQVKCFTYPADDGDEENSPVEVLELDTCTSAVVTMASRTICARPRTLLLEFFEKEGEVLVNRFLSADSMAEMKEWEKRINSVVGALRSWNCIA